MKSKGMRRTGQVTHEHTGRRGAHTGFSWEIRKEGLLGRLKYRWEDNIKMNLREI
jgi:hypothetical protein